MQNDFFLLMENSAASYNTQPKSKVSETLYKTLLELEIQLTTHQDWTSSLQTLYPNLLQCWATALTTRLFKHYKHMLLIDTSKITNAQSYKYIPFIMQIAMSIVLYYNLNQLVIYKCQPGPPSSSTTTLNLLLCDLSHRASNLRYHEVHHGPWP